MEKDCIFCKIAAGDIPTEKVSETGDFVVIKDIHPKAPVHFLIIPKKHIEDLRTMPDDIWLGIKKLALELAKNKDIKSFRLVHNVGDAAIVKHAHVHMLGGITKDREV